MKLVLLVCGTGASSGFMASNARKAAKERNVPLDFIARSDSVIEDYIEGSSLVMIGPHLSYLLDDLKDDYGSYNVPMAIIKDEVYGSLNGDGLVNQVLEILDNK